MGKTKFIIGFVLLIGSFFSCQTIHEYPDANLDKDSTSINLKLFLNLNLQMGEAEYILSSRAAVSACDPRMTVAVYRLENNTWGDPLYKYVTTYPDAGSERPLSVSHLFQLSAAKYLFIAWADYVQAGSKDDLFYNTGKLNMDNATPDFGYSVSLLGGYIGNTDFKDAFCGYTIVDLREYKEREGLEVTASVDLKRPLAKVEVITTDEAEYYQKSRGAKANSTVTAEFTYSSFFPSSYNIFSDSPNNYVVSPGFASQLKALDNAESMVGFDYVFVGKQQTELTLNLLFKNQEGRIISRIDELHVPVKQNQKTTVRGKFLTRQFESGVVVNPDFEEGDIIVNMPD